jgi:transcriptional regulator
MAVVIFATSLQNFLQLKKLAVKNKDLINPRIGRVRGTAKRGVSNLAKKVNETIDKCITDIEGGA